MINRAPLPRGVRLRPARESDLPACATIWRDGLNDYMGRLNLPEIPDELAPISRLHAHVLSTDPERFWVATRNDDEPIAFGAAARRDDLWFLSMLFVRPGEQGVGIGPAILERILPADDAILATATDAAQPISNALYARYGIVPRMALLPLIGYVERPEALGELPAGIVAIPFETLAGGPPGGDGHRRLVETVDALDREVTGFTHPQDHRFLRTEGRSGFLYRGPDDAPLGYGYGYEVGRVGPVVVRDPALLAPIAGHLVRTVPPRGATAVWAPGHAGDLVTRLLEAGLRIDGFPILLCWSRPFADFQRFVPASPGLL